MRDHKIKEWFQSWNYSSWDHFTDIFEEDVYYSESWGPEYNGIDEIKRWFTLWHKEAQMLRWNIKQIIHIDNISIVEWYFSCMDHAFREFDGISLIEWSENDKIRSLKEFASSLPHYDPFKVEK